MRAGGFPVSALAGRVIALILLTAACWAVGLQLANSLAIAVVAITLYGLRGLVSGDPDTWEAEPELNHNEGARREVARLSWGLQGPDERVDRWSIHRLRALAARRLAEQDLDLDSRDDAESCRRVLGTAAYDALSSDPNRLPRFAQFVAALDVVERLTPEETPR